MKRRSSVLAVAMAAVVLVSCGRPLSVDDYLRQAGDIRSGYRAVYDERGDVYERETAVLGADDDPGFVRLTRGLIADTSPAYDEAIAAFEDLEPPPDFADAHAAYLEAAHAHRDLLRSVEADLESAGSVEDVTALISGSGLADAQIRVESACRSLEMLGADNDLTVDLSC